MLNPLKGVNRLNQPEMTLPKWLERSRIPSIRIAIENDYYVRAWRPIVNHFKNRDSLLTWDDFLIGLHLAYSWMPTIPKLERTFSVSAVQQSQAIEVINRLRELGKMPNVEELETLKSICNNSIIGVSKLLHFISPDSCPIYDRRVARRFFRPNIYNVNRVALYVSYRDTLKSWLQNTEIRERIEEMRASIKLIEDAPPIRVLELVLFEDER